MWILLIASLLVCLERPVFVPLMISTTYIAWYFVKETISWEAKFYFYAGSLIFAIILDIVWLSVYTSHWWNKVYNDSGSLRGLRTFTVFVSYVLLLIEVVLDLT